MKKQCFVSLFSLVICIAITAQEALRSPEEKYFDFLSLRGLIERPTLNFRTLSDNVWNISETANHPWQAQNLGTFHQLSDNFLFGDFRARIYGPDLFMSVNTAAPYGQNDGVLWQGRGFNARLKGGARLEGQWVQDHRLELTFLPHFAFSQNARFDFIQPNEVYRYNYRFNFTGRAELFGYHGIPFIDAPQRFGNRAFFDWDFGDSEIRYAWRNFTVGFGTQAIWLGPAQLNPILHSNNAPAYPKLDIGLRRQPLTLPRSQLHVGDFEFRLWWGSLTESAWFDNDPSNDRTLIAGYAFAYSFPSFLRGLTVGYNHIILSKEPLSLRGFLDTGTRGSTDTRISIIIDYLLPIVGFNVYFEWGRDDYSPNLHYYIRYPFHTQAFTFGARKAFRINDRFKGKILLEITNLESSRDYDRLIGWSTTFYSHHRVIQGHTNRGQWLGAGIGTGGNSQYLGFTLFHPRGYGNIFFQRRNPDLDYTWFIDSLRDDHPYGTTAERNIRTFLDFGISGLYFFRPNLSFSGSFVFRDEHNPLNQARTDGSRRSERRFNVHLSTSIRFSF